MKKGSFPGYWKIFYEMAVRNHTTLVDFFKLSQIIQNAVEHDTDDKNRNLFLLNKHLNRALYCGKNFDFSSMVSTILRYFLSLALKRKITLWFTWSTNTTTRRIDKKSDCLQGMDRFCFVFLLWPLKFQTAAIFHFGAGNLHEKWNKASAMFIVSAKMRFLTNCLRNLEELKLLRCSNSVESEEVVRNRVMN